MKTKELDFLIQLSEVHSKIVQSFDTGLGNGIGFNDFLILYHLSKSKDQMMRRIDLAEKISLTPSGVTRMLLPMEKIGLIERNTSPDDARVSYVKLASGGKRLFEEALERADIISKSYLSTMNIKKIDTITDIFQIFRLPIIK